MRQCCISCMRELNTEDPVCPHCGFDRRSYGHPEFALPLGDQLHAGKYLIGRVLGQGGFGITYVGLDQSLELKVAIKEYFPTGMASRSTGTSALSWHTSEADRDSGRKSFIKEARKMAKIHRIPNVVEVRDVFYENDTAYIVMDFVEGETLKDRLTRTGPMDAESCTQTLRPIMESLVMAHDRGLVHRDISPDNIMLDPAGTVWLLDMGAAKDLDAQGGIRTQSSQMVVKRGFSPPEQSASAGETGAWSDVYAMCATIYYCVSGKLTPDAVDRLMGAPLEMPESIPRNLAAVLEHGLALRPNERIQSMGELIEALDGATRKQKKKTNVQKQIPHEGSNAWTRLLDKVRRKHPPREANAAPAEQSSVTDRTIPKAVKAGVPVALCVLLALLVVPEFMRTRGFEYELYDGHAVITGYSAKSESVEIPSKIWGKPVTSIGTDAFSPFAHADGVELSHVTIPDSVTTIGDYAFAYTGLRTVNIPAGVLSIGDGAFSACSFLTNIEVAPGNRMYQDVDGVLFSQDMLSILCYPAGKADSAYSVPDGVLNIGCAAFRDCDNLREIDLPDGIMSIYEDAFYSCDGLETVRLPDTVEVIGTGAFGSCGGLSSAIVPLDTTVSKVSFDETTEVIRVGTLREYGDCGESAAWTFYDNGVLIVSGTGPMADFGYVYRVADHSYYSYNIPWWGFRDEILSVYILEGITTLGKSSFAFCVNMTGISLPDSLTAIGKYALSGNEVLVDMTIPAGVAEIGVSAFEETKITNVVIPGKVSVIEGGVFSRCYELTDVIFQDGVTEIGLQAFFNCYNLKSVTIPDSVRSVKTQAFDFCRGLTDVYFDGTEEQWKTISVQVGNDPLNEANIHFYGS